jgi:hypothetical protein
VKTFNEGDFVCLANDREGKSLVWFYGRDIWGIVFTRSTLDLEDVSLPEVTWIFDLLSCQFAVIVSSELELVSRSCL